METGMKLINRDKAIMAFRECLWSKPEVHPSLDLDDVDTILYGMPTENIYTEQNVRDAFTEGYGAGRYDCTHWIPCCERMPEEKKEVLISADGELYIAEYEIDHGKGYWSEVIEYRNVTDVDAWMPLPDPYGGEQE